MSLLTPAVKTVVGEPEVVEDDRANTPSKTGDRSSSSRRGSR
jgi:hypothetical protein